MPVLDGIEALRRLRAEEAEVSESKGGTARHQFVIALSANSDDETKQEALTAGADVFKAKPFSYESFLELYVH